MKSGIISDSVKLFIAHFCHQAQADPVGWVIREGGLLSVSIQIINSSTYTLFIEKLNIATAKLNITITTASLLFDITPFCFVLNFTYASSILCVAQHPYNLCAIRGLCHFLGCFGNLLLFISLRLLEININSFNILHFFIRRRLKRNTDFKKKAFKSLH